MHYAALLALSILIIRCATEPAKSAEYPRMAPLDTCRAPTCYPDPYPRAP
jgi:hypothetical protein